MLLKRISLFSHLFQSLYCKYDKEEMTKEEHFKMHYNEHNRIQSFGGIIRHHNPAYDGIVNAGFVHHGSDSPVLRFNQHQYNNGNTIREESISMTTFGKENVVRRNGQILDAYNLQNPN